MPSMPLIVNIFVPLATFAVAIAAAYFFRGISLPVIAGGVLITAGASIATQALTGAGIFAATPGKVPHPSTATITPQEASTPDLEQSTGHKVKTVEATAQSIEAALKQGKLSEVAETIRSTPALADDETLSREVIAVSVAESREEQAAKLIQALIEANPKLATLSIDHQIGDIQQREPLLHYLIYRQDKNSVQHILSHSVDVPGLATALDENGLTALHAAVRTHDFSLVSQLYKLDPAAAHKVDARGFNVFHCLFMDGGVVAEAEASEMLEIAKLFCADSELLPLLSQSDSLGLTPTEMAKQVEGSSDGSRTTLRQLKACLKPRDHAIHRSLQRQVVAAFETALGSHSGQQFPVADVSISTVYPSQSSFVMLSTKKLERDRT
jgi:hypothetical protein